MIKKQGVKHRVGGPRIKDTKFSYHPQIRAEALKQGIIFYDPVPGRRCEVHRRRNVLIYTVSDLPKCCAAEAAAIAYRVAYDNGEPLSRIQAVDMRLSYYWMDKPCYDCGHVGKVRLDGLCFECGQRGIATARCGGLYEL